MDKKRIAIIIGFIIFTVLLGWVLYRVFFTDQPIIPGTGQEPTTQEPGTLPTTGDRTSTVSQPGGPGTLPTSPGVTQPTSPTQTDNEGSQISQVVTAPSTGVSVESNEVTYYNQDDGRFYRRNSNGELSLLSDDIFFNVQQVVWNPDNDSAIIEYPDGANIYYDFSTDAQVTLPTHWEDFAFSANGEKIVAKSLGLSTENRWLVASDPNGENVQFIEPLGDNADKVDVDWSPNNQIVATARTGDAISGDREEILFVGTANQNFRSIIVEGRGFESTWSPGGTKLLYSVYSRNNDFKPQLWVVNASPDTIGTGRKSLNLQTWSYKCDFVSDRIVYCAVPTELPSGAGFAPELAATIPDSIYRIDLQTGSRTKVVDGTDIIGSSISTLHVSPDEQTINYTQTFRSGVFELSL